MRDGKGSLLFSNLLFRGGSVSGLGLNACVDLTTIVGPVAGGVCLAGFSVVSYLVLANHL